MAEGSQTFEQDIARLIMDASSTRRKAWLRRLAHQPAVAPAEHRAASSRWRTATRATARRPRRRTVLHGDHARRETVIGRPAPVGTGARRGRRCRGRPARGRLARPAAGPDVRSGGRRRGPDVRSGGRRRGPDVGWRGRRPREVSEASPSLAVPKRWGFDIAPPPAYELPPPHESPAANRPHPTNRPQAPTHHPYTPNDVQDAPPDRATHRPAVRHARGRAVPADLRGAHLTHGL